MAGQLWEVIGGGEKGGVLVRAAQGLESAHLPERLSTGAIVRGLELTGNRLRYELLTGTGPASGWVTISLQGRYLLVTAQSSPQRPSGAAQAPAAAAPAPPAPPPAAVAAPARAPSGTGGLGPRPPLGPGGATVLVRGLAGEEVARVSAEASLTVLALKEQLAGVCHVPSKQQQILHGTRILNDNSLVAALGKHAEVQLVKLTEGYERIKLDIVGAWSLSGVRCSLAVDLKVTLKEVKAMIQDATGLKARDIELDGGPFTEWQDDKEALGDILRKKPQPDETLTAYLFARAPPERARLMEDVASGRISAAAAAAIDPDLLMPAC